MVEGNMGISYYMYITAQSLKEALFSTEKQRAVANRLKNLGFSGVILESYRGGCCLSEKELSQAQGVFKQAGLATLGGLMPVYGSGFGKGAEGNELRLPTFCYSNEETLHALENVICGATRIFGNVVIDDAFMTACRCDECNIARKGASWPEFRRGLLSKVAERWVAAARRERADSKLIIKFPQYYDRYHLYGYDIERFPQIFDAVWQGTETRNPGTFAYGYVEPYQGYVNYRLMQTYAGTKLEGAWFDALDCDEQLFYEQAVTTVIAGATVITLFSYNDGFVNGSILGRVMQAKEVLDKLSTVAKNPWGVHVVKPPHSDAHNDYFLFDYLGMLGIPCVPVRQIDLNARVTIVTAHALNDPATSDRLRKALLSGREIIATFDVLTHLSPDILELFGYEPRGIASGRTRVEYFDINGTHYRTTTAVYIAGDLQPVEAAVRAWAGVTDCEGGKFKIPFVTVRTLSTGGKAIVWNVDSFDERSFSIVERLNVPVPPSILNMPKEVGDLLRSTATAPLGYVLQSPSRVATYLFPSHVVFVNFNSTPAEIEVKGLPWLCETLLSDSTHTACTKDRLLLSPRSFACLQRALPPSV